ncbi:AAA family ATPase [Aeromonas hydrophila]|uniref:AAA family ATPase n=1 Tax=Aeromonas hydrophila TaxID=644 RepID=UPI001C5BE803|nr:AAA family ATPase [Aeromonas hydrophila]MBW3808338.1 AAA domain-containing protein [Aeromonas hydrophila]
MTAAVVNATAFTNEHFPRLLALLKTMGDRAHFDSEQSDLYRQFIEQFPLDSLPNLTLEQYCVGKGDGNSFCWWIERGLQPVLARYMPGTSRGHLLYFQKDGTVYKHQRLAELGDEGALRYTLKVQHCVAAADPDSDLSWIDNDEALYKQAGVEPRVTMGHGRKLRLVTCYHPKRMLPISSSAHLGHFLNVLGWPSADIPPENQPMGRMQRLVRYYDLARESLPDLTPFGFASGLYQEALGLAPQKTERNQTEADDEDDTMSEANANPVIPKTNEPLNQILFGPPGTGKTYHTINKALAILDPECLAQHDDDVSPEARKALKTRFDELVKEGRIDFVTFHQSFSYEDFVEGIRAESDGDSGQLTYDVVDGVFKRMCDAVAAKVTRSDSHEAMTLEGRRVWKMSLGNTQGDDAHIFDDCIEQGLIRLGYGSSHDYSECRTRSDVQRVLERSVGKIDNAYDYTVTSVMTLVNRMKIGDLVVVTDGNFKFRAIGEITGDYRSDVHYEGDDSYAQVRPVKWLCQFSPSLPCGELINGRFSQMTLYELKAPTLIPEKLLALVNATASQAGSQSELGATPANKRVLIIDEINRGNVSRIFGELITLIEPSKRAGASEALTTTLPYSKRPFSVPDNLYLIGTMNTADRSLAGLDIALRRRFVFEEMPPRAELLDGVVIEEQGHKVDVGRLLRTLNQRIEVLLDRDHCLGHAYFMPLKAAAKPTLAQLGYIFQHQILPLLQEYFFEDWQRIAWVLNDHRKSSAEAMFLEPPKLDIKTLLGDIAVGGQRQRWSINEKAFTRIEAYALTIEGDKGAQ